VEIPDYHRFDGAAVTNQDDEELGRIDGLFVDDALGVPTWVAVRSGMFGSHHSLVPLAQRRFVQGRRTHGGVASRRYRRGDGPCHRRTGRSRPADHRGAPPAPVPPAGR
jgi:hypothetical protein